MGCPPLGHQLLREGASISLESGTVGVNSVHALGTYRTHLCTQLAAASASSLIQILIPRAFPSPPTQGPCPCAALSQTATSLLLHPHIPAAHEAQSSEYINSLEEHVSSLVETYQAQPGKSVEVWGVQAVDQSQCSRGTLTQGGKIRATFSLWIDKYLEHPLVAKLEDTCNPAGDPLAQQPVAPPAGRTGIQPLQRQLSHPLGRAMAGAFHYRGLGWPCLGHSFLGAHADSQVMTPRDSCSKACSVSHSPKN